MIQSRVLFSFGLRAHTFKHCVWPNAINRFRDTMTILRFCCSGCLPESVFCCCRCHIFVALAEDDEGMIGPEGMEKFCEDIGVEPENVHFLFAFVFIKYYFFLVEC